MHRRCKVNIWIISGTIIHAAILLVLMVVEECIFRHYMKLLLQQQQLPIEHLKCTSHPIVLEFLRYS